MATKEGGDRTEKASNTEKTTGTGKEQTKDDRRTKDEDGEPENEQDPEGKENSRRVVGSGKTNRQTTWVHPEPGHCGGSERRMQARLSAQPRRGPGRRMRTRGEIGKRPWGGAGRAEGDKAGQRVTRQGMAAGVRT